MLRSFRYFQVNHMRICRLTIDDYDDIVQLWKRTSLPYKAEGRDSRSAIEVQMKKYPSFFLGAYDKDMLVGIAVASYDYRRGWINRLAVDPKCRRRGIARKLITAAEKALRRKGAKVFSAHIEDGNTASLNLFKRCGYVEHRDVIYLSKRENDEV